MDKQQYADKYSRAEWQKLCLNQEFVDAFWEDDFDACDEIAK